MILKIISIIGVSMVLIIFVLYGPWFMTDINRQNILSLVAENMHTGLTNPPSGRLALDGKPKNSNIAKQNLNQISPINQNNSVIVGDQAVLFDISAQPVFSQNNINFLSFLATVLVFFILVVLSSYIYWTRKKKKNN